MRLALAALLSLAGVPAAAQGLADQYAAAVRAFMIPMVLRLGMGNLMEEGPIAALLPSLKGN